MIDRIGLDAGKRALLRAGSAALLLAWLPSCGRSAAADNGQTGAAAGDERVLRKQRSEKRLKAEGVPTNDHLPPIETETEARLRSAGEVAGRLLALTLVAVKADGLLSGESAESVRSMIDSAISERQADGLFTPGEKALIRALKPDRNDQIQFNWRYEAAWVLAWALRWIDGPLDPRKGADVPLLSGIVHDEPDLARRGLRPLGEILDEADLIYRYHWAAREARLRGKPLPPGLTEDVVSEWHHALNWLIGYQGQAGDEVTTDT